MCDCMVLGSEHVKLVVLLHKQFKGDRHSSPTVSAMQVCAVNSQQEF